jgi:transcriptional regulator with XRE-family HTH domain
MTLAEEYFEVGQRIRELRGSFTQAEFAARLGVDRKSVVGWESGKRLPDGASMLRLVAEFRADVNYLLTGIRGGPTLSSEEAVLLANFRHCAPAGKANLMQTSALLASGMGSSSSMNMSNVGDGNVQVGHAGGNVSSRVKK